VSFWLLLFSVFFFLSLGYLKRYVELRSSAREPDELLSGRGYTRSDTEIVAISGLAAGMVSILVMVLFAEAMGKSGAYATPQLLWLLPLPLLYWLNRIWMMARRGQVDSDPVAFAVTDARSLAVGAIMAGLLSTQGTAALYALAKLVGTLYIGLAVVVVMMCLVLLAIGVLVGVPVGWGLGRRGRR
jgi:hypothetical protein